jgi:hypothetical protein
MTRKRRLPISVRTMTPPSAERARTSSRCAVMDGSRKPVCQGGRLEPVAYRGYFNGEKILGCEDAGINVTLPRPMTSRAKAEGRFGKQGVRYEELVFIVVKMRGSRLTTTS